VYGLYFSFAFGLLPSVTGFGVVFVRAGFCVGCGRGVWVGLLGDLCLGDVAFVCV